MSTTKHTPGPLLLIFLEGRYVGSTHDEQAARMTQPRGDEYTFIPETQAAEAPALLAALKHIAGHWEAAEESGNIEYAIDLVTCEECMQLALTAIARAEGRE